MASARTPLRALDHDLQRTVDGEVIGDPDRLVDFCTDFGGIVDKTPAAVVRPLGAGDVSRVVRYAHDHQLRLAVRGAGHSQGGQSLVEDGILLDVTSLSGVEAVEPDGWLQAGAGTPWGTVVGHAAAVGRQPPVLTNNFTATLGGTHATGGVGVSSFRHGAQAENCVGLEVVTGTGDIIWCSADVEAELFDHVRCGLGRFGVITTVRHALRRPARFVRTDTLLYDNLFTLLQDLRAVTEHDRFHYLDAFVTRHPREDSWLFPLRLSRETDTPDRLEPARLPGARQCLGTELAPVERFVGSLTDPPARHDNRHVRPWVDAFLSWDEAASGIESTLRAMPRDIPCRYALRPLRPGPHPAPLLVRPPGKHCLGFGAYPVFPRDALGAAVERMDMVSRQLTAGTGKRYLSGWTHAGVPDWHDHYAGLLGQIGEAQDRFDPHRVLGPGVTCEQTGSR